MAVTKKKKSLKEMTIQELYYYNCLVRQQIDSTLVRLRGQLKDLDSEKTNENRMKYNKVLEAVQEEINKRIFDIVI
jgi:hypothetical protein